MAKVFTKALILLFVLTLVSRSASLSLALETENLGISPQKVNPGSFYYPLKRTWEKLRELLIFSREGKLTYYENLLEKRFSELDYVTENQVVGEVQKASERFSFYAGVLVETWETGEKKEEEKERLLEKFEKYAEFLNIFTDRFPANSAYWLLLRQNRDTLKILSEHMKE